ncbi:MAG: polyphosphate--AMP phosphotransferase [Eggerthellaceae bacterium]|nr:polyphosphate--AMP phosphotransferase [Eggerthellaceae bacterium]
MLEQVDFKSEKMTKEEYKPRQKELINKLVVLQQKARAKGVGLVVLFEGWAGAGKGSRISDLMYELDARATSVHVTTDINIAERRAFPGAAWDVTDFKPVMQEFWQSLGERGTITFYDRGWYTAAIGQALVEMSSDELAYVRRVMVGENVVKKSKKAKKAKGGLLSEAGASKIREEFHDNVVASYQRIALNFERMLVDDGYIVIKLFVHVSKDAQLKRLERLRSNPNTAWRAGDEKLAQVKYYDQAYELYDRLLEKSNFSFAPWTLVNGEDKREANLQVAQALVDAIEHALVAQPDEAAQAALKKAAENSARAAAAIAQGGAEETKADNPNTVLEAAEAEAALQHSQAPRGSNYIIMAGHPRIDHSVPKPVIESNEEYRKQLKAEQARFRELELEMYQKRVPLMLMYEGWDAAGKGGNIKRVCQAIDARAYTVFPSPAPTKPELMHPHLWRYWIRLPKAGHVGIYDRSWYGRVLVERVEGFSSPQQWGRAYDEINAFEYELVQWGAVLLKFWVDITPEEQLRRFEARQADPNKIWKITEEDWRNRDKYPQYKMAVDDMFRLTSTTFAPWIVLESDDKHYARIQALKAINEALEERMHK